MHNIHEMASEVAEIIARNFEKMPADPVSSSGP